MLGVPGIKLRRTDTTLDLSSREPRSDKDRSAAGSYRCTSSRQARLLCALFTHEWLWRVDVDRRRFLRFDFLYAEKRHDARQSK